jgi:biotin-dependent carboxylase-like uncharacterized protein
MSGTGTPALEVVAAGLQATVQDCGRVGFFKVGVPPSGAQDLTSLRVANALAGNAVGRPLMVRGDAGAAGIEVLLGGLKVRALRDLRVAVTGAEAGVRVNREAVPQWRRIDLAEGDELQLAPAGRGLRQYLAVEGGIDVPPYLDSRSTFLRGRVGGLEGRPLRAGDVLGVLPTVAPRAAPADHLVDALRPSFPDTWELRVIRGPQDDLFVQESVAAFFESMWTLSPTSDRMGFRFDGPKLSFGPRPDYLRRDAGENPSNIVDDPIPIGGIQVPSGLELIAMGVDGPSAGGLAKIASVLVHDMPRLGQMRPGQKARFVEVTTRESVELMKAEERALAALGENEDGAQPQ